MFIKKRRIHLLVIICIMCMSFLLLSASVQANEIRSTGTYTDGVGIVYSYDTESGQASVTGFVGSIKDVVIPREISVGENSYLVTAIGNRALRYKRLTSINIPNSVTTIGVEAFSLNELTSLAIPNSVTTIERLAFSDNRITSVVIPDSVTTIGDSAFHLNRLVSVELPDSLTTIAFSAFSWNEITELVIPDSVTSIGDSAFYANKLTSITIPDSVTEIGARAFMWNELTSVDIPNSVTVINDGAFADNKLTSVSIPDSLTTIEDSLFYNNRLTNIDIPTSVTTIEAHAFLANNLQHIDIPTSITSIGAWAFGTNQFEHIVVPNSVTTIGDGAFANKSLKTIFIPNSVTSIGGYCFYDSLIEGIYTDVGHSETLKNLLNENVMSGIGEYYDEELEDMAKIEANTVLYEGTSRYSENVNLVNQVTAGDSLSFDAISKTRYVYNNIETTWNEYTPQVQWYKDGEALQGQMDLRLTLDDIQEEDIGVYYAEVDGEILADINVTFDTVTELEEESEVPNEEEIVEPENENTPTLADRVLTGDPTLYLGVVGIGIASLIATFVIRKRRSNEE